MYSMNDLPLTTVYDAAHRFASKNVFFQNFAAQSKLRDAHAIIEIIRGIPVLKSLTIRECYAAKSNEEAKKFLSEAEEMNENEIKISHFTKALFAAKIKSDDQNIFFDSLIHRIRWSFVSEHINSCFKDCQYMITLLKDEICPNLKEIDYHIYKIECFSHATRCLKILGLTEEAKTWAQDGIREAKHFFKKMEAEGSAINNEKKLEWLHPFLDVLKNSQNNAKRCGEPRTAIIRVGKTSVPKVLGEQNEKLHSCSNGVALRYDEARGRHLVATRNIKTGSVLIVDKPFAWSTDKEMLKNNCLHCHESLESTDGVHIPCHNCQTVKFCSEDCRRESWEKYHRWECIVFDHFYQMQTTQSSRLLLAYRTTVLMATRNVDTADKPLSSELMKYFSKNDSDAQQCEIGLNDTYDSLDYRTVYSLQTNEKDIDPKVNLMHTIHSVLLAKCFRFVSNHINSNTEIGDHEEIVLTIAMLRHLQAINSNAYEIVENVLDTRTKIWEPRTVGGAIYSTVSLTNHSCFPNVVRHTYPKGQVVVRTIRFIPKGSEILDCYGPHFLRDVRTDRQEYLLTKYNFHCICEACDNNLEPPLSASLYKCKNCSAISKELTNSCANCGTKIDRLKIDKTIKKSIQQRSTAIKKMSEGDHAASLPILLRHAELVDKIFADYSFEAIKTQQAVIQCLNSMGCISQ